MYSLEALSTSYLGQEKVSISKLFGRPKLRKDGTEGKLITVPSIAEIHANEETRKMWMDYSTLDAELTFDLREVRLFYC